MSYVMLNYQVLKFSKNEVFQKFYWAQKCSKYFSPYKCIFDKWLKASYFELRQIKN